MLKFIKKHSGFTLVEIMVAIVIITITMLFGLSFFTYGHKDVVKGKHVNYALQLAKDTVESIKTMQYLSIPVSANNTHNKYGVNFDCYYGSNETVTATNEQYKVIFVTVTWLSNGVLQNINLHTIVVNK